MASAKARPASGLVTGGFWSVNAAAPAAANVKVSAARAARRVCSACSAGAGRWRPQVCSRCRRLGNECAADGEQCLWPTSRHLYALDAITAAHGVADIELIYRT